MSQISTEVSGRCTLIIAAVASMWLTGCGNDTSRTEGSKIVLDVAKGLKAKMLGKKQPPVKVDPEALAVIAKNSFAGPLIMASIESLGTVSALGELGHNGSTRTYSTPNQQTLTFRSGLLIATRGLGHDLMSADIRNAADLISRRQSGSYPRLYRYLDGESVERPLPVSCNVIAGDRKDIAFAGNSYATTEINETCSATGLAIKNTYWVTQGGKFARSRQWIGPVLGYVTIDLVRADPA